MLKHSSPGLSCSTCSVQRLGRLHSWAQPSPRVLETPPQLRQQGLKTVTHKVQHCWVCWLRLGSIRLRAWSDIRQLIWGILCQNYWNYQLLKKQMLLVLWLSSRSSSCPVLTKAVWAGHVPLAIDVTSWTGVHPCGSTQSCMLTNIYLRISQYSPLNNALCPGTEITH